MPASFETTCGVISREQLVEATEETITEVEGYGILVSDELQAKVRRVAQTAKKITGAWKIGDCGCLIGTLYLERDGSSGVDDWDPSREENEIACVFAWVLSEVIGRDDENDSSVFKVFNVVDAIDQPEQEVQA